MDAPLKKEGNNSKLKILIGICAMAKKANSSAMKEITGRLKRFHELNVYTFEEEMILEKPIEQWPIVDCLLSFHSQGFPLDKAIQYSELRKPFLINDLYLQYNIQDRRDVHKILKEQNISQPRYAILHRDDASNTEQNIIEEDDKITINESVFNKPFVEKPISAEDHNVYIYFPSSAGGGSQRLFRKIGSRSSFYSTHSKIRQTGSYIYEEFMPTDGCDVKVYTVGPDYAHAEARKSPALDGKVERKDGKEIRYPVLLSAREKFIARKIVLAFKQNICGFDLLRANGTSYVCDVNGFSFVKNSGKYYDDCAKILGNMVLRNLAPSILHFPNVDCETEDKPIVPTTSGKMMELCCVIAVIRHGDRTPKQKMKMEVKHKKFLDLFEFYGGPKTGQLKLKSPQQLQEVLDIARYLLAEINKNSTNNVCEAIEEKCSKLEQLKSILEMHGHFSGINRKVQLKYKGIVVNNSGHGLSSRSICTDLDVVPEPTLILILKWGGELTSAGKQQAEELGKAFQCLYPGVKRDYSTLPGLGLLRLHSTFRHDLKIYASEEGRVQMTAAAFAKGLLSLEGELTPILVQMVKSANMNGLLDSDNEAEKYQTRVKEKLQTILNQDSDFKEKDYINLGANDSIAIANALNFIGNPYKACNEIHRCMKNILQQLNELSNEKISSDENKLLPKLSRCNDISVSSMSPKKIESNCESELYKCETWDLLIRRWTKLVKDFKTKDNKWDISKIPDIYDCIKYDLQHNYKFLSPKGGDSDNLYSMAKAFADIVIPQEYGITKEEKLQIGQCICNPLMKKILSDLQRNVDEDATRLDSRYSKGVSTPHRHVRTRLYFTSESHIHSLLTILTHGNLCNIKDDTQWERSKNFISAISELNYMTQIIIMVYEDPTKEVLSEERFHVELHFSPGAYHNVRGKKYPAGLGYRPVSTSTDDTKKQSSQRSFKSFHFLEPFWIPTDTITHRHHTSIDENFSIDSKDTLFPFIPQIAFTSPYKPTKLLNYRIFDPPPMKEKITSDEDYSRFKKWHKKNSNSISGTKLQQCHSNEEIESFDKPYISRIVPNNATIKQGLISTSVISGSLSAPALSMLEKGEAVRLVSGEGWAVQSIRPLETIHNSLTLKGMEIFLKNMINAKTNINNITNDHDSIEIESSV